MTDNRLLDCDTKAEIEANFVRILALIDANSSNISTNSDDIESLDERVTALETPSSE